MDTDTLNNFILNMTLSEFVKYYGFVWIYSSNFGNKWWIYNNDVSFTIERLYRERLNGSVDKNKLHQLNILNQNIIDKMFNNKKKLTDNKNISNIISSPIKISNDEQEVTGFTFDDIFIENEIHDTNNDNDNDNDDNKLKKDLLLTLNLLNDPPSSDIVNIGSKQYRIDLDKFIQINNLFPDKKRGIKRLEIKQENFDDIIGFLKLKQIKGVAGVSF